MRTKLLSSQRKIPVWQRRSPMIRCWKLGRILSVFFHTQTVSSLHIVCTKERTTFRYDLQDERRSCESLRCDGSYTLQGKHKEHIKYVKLLADFSRSFRKDDNDDAGSALLPSRSETGEFMCVCGYVNKRLSSMTRHVGQCRTPVTHQRLIAFVMHLKLWNEDHFVY